VRSFWWMTIGTVFEAVRKTEEEEKKEVRRQAKSSRCASKIRKMPKVLHL
jgi:hypothetical protein